MMLFIVILLILLMLLVVVVIGLSQRQGNTRYQEAEQAAPAELRTATRLDLPGMLTMAHPFALHGEPDHVYRLADGRLVVREDKTSWGHLDAAVIQASVYAAILRHNAPPALRGVPVAAHGWVRQGTPEKNNVRYVEVQLLTDAELQHLIHTYRALGKGWAPRRAGSIKTCQFRCEYFQKACPGTTPGADSPKYPVNHDASIRDSRGIIRPHR